MSSVVDAVAGEGTLFGASVGGGVCPPLSDNSAYGDVTGRVVVDLVSGDDLVGLQICEVERLLGGVRRAKARLDGFETELVGALEVLRRRARLADPEPDSGAGSDQGPDGDPDRDHQPDGSGDPATDGPDDPDHPDPDPDPDPDPQPDPDPDPEPAPVPSARKTRLSRERSQRAGRYPQVAGALKAGRINIEQFDLLTRSGLTDKVINQLLEEAIESGSADATRDLVARAKSERDRKNPELRLARQRDRRRFSTGIDEDGNRWFNLVVDPVMGEAIMGLFQTAERREWQLTDKPSKNRRTATQRAADAFAGLITNNPTGNKTKSKRSGGLPDHGAHLVIDLDNYLRIMLGDPTAVAHTIGGSQIPASTWRQFHNHGAELFAWVLAADGVEMNLARGSRHATEVQKMAMAIRDGTCITEHCDRHPGACDGHHLIEWEHHGQSDIASMALQCPSHHTWLHQTGCRIEPGNQPHEWRLTQTHTGRIIHTWTNPPPPWRQPPAE